MTSKNSLLGITIDSQSKGDILEKIYKYLSEHKDFVNIVSLNPEILIETQKNKNFKSVVETAQIRIIDGSGIILATKLKGVPVGDRFTGVELMQELLKIASNQRLRVMLLGGMPKIAYRIVDRQKQAGSKAIFTATYGIKDKQNPQSYEDEKIISIVRSFKPHIILVSFGSPFSEMWIDNHRSDLKGVVCASVGGSFNYLAGIVKQPPRFIRLLGLEYLYRLITEPYRWKRQLSLITFAKKAIVEAIRYRVDNNRS